MVHSCTVVGCTSCNRKDPNKPGDSIEDAESEDLRIVLDEKGTVLDKDNIRYHCLPSVPKLKNPKDQTTQEKEELARVLTVRREWIHSICRADVLPKDIRICSLHFAPSAYDPLAPMKHGCSTYLDVPTKKLLLPNAVPTENLVNKKKSVLKVTERSQRMEKKTTTATALEALQQHEYRF